MPWMSTLKVSTRDRLYKVNREMAQEFEGMTGKLRNASLLFRKLSSNSIVINVSRLS